MEWYSQNLEKNLEDLEMEVETLNAMINKLLRRVSKENDKGLQTLPEVKDWISKAEEHESKASSLLDQSISECQDLSGWTLVYNTMVCKTLKEVKDLRSEGVFKELVERAPLSHVRKMIPLQPIVSREMFLEKVWKCLAENKCRTLGLYGMAGVGKTTLLTQIQKKFIEDGDASSLVLFVVVESEEEVEGIQDEIGKRLGLDMIRPKDKKEKAFEILEILNVKRFMLLLDGIQREVDLEEIGVPLPSRENGCRIVFTTRSREACGSKWVDAVEEVKCLSPEEAWDIFKEIVGETTLNSHPDIPQLARIVARNCGGLPIALSLIGETMSRKRTVKEWHHAIHVLVLVSSTAESTYTKYEIFPVLKFSYDSLPGENIKLCFLYCALFPKDDDISKQDLVDCWIGEGIIEDEDREIAEIQGYGMMGDLVRMRLLMDNESGYGVKMHGMVREMALWIASDFGRQKENFVVVGGQRIHQMPEVNDWRIVTRLSVTCTRIENISGFPDCSELKTLLLQGNSNLKWISGDFFRWMTSLVVLNLSYNRELAELPEEVSSLVSLQFLNLSFTSIKRLPLGLKELKRLIHLDLDYTTHLQEIEVIGSLLNLKVLRLFRSVPMDLSLMEDIQLLKSLQELSVTVREADVLKRLLSIHQLARCIRNVYLTEIKITDGGILLLNSLLSLRELNIGKCEIPEITISWGSPILREMLHFGNIKKIPLLENIHTVTLSLCTGLRDLTWLLFAPNLGHLRIDECQQIERVIKKEKAAADMSEQPFQNLTRLSLDSLPQLESIYWSPLPFPVLEYLYIRACPKLTRLPFNSDSAKGNQVRSDLDQEWIKGVEWEDEATKQRFSGFDDRDFQKMAEEQKMDAFASSSHQIENIVTSETSESGKRTTTNNITDFNDRDFQKMAEDQKMDGLASSSHQIENIVTGETSESGKRTTANSITDFVDRDFQKMAEDQKMDGLTSLSHQIENIITGETSEGGKRANASIITDFDNWEFQKMAEDQKMDGSASLSHQIENIVTGETSESGKRTTANIIADFDDRQFTKMVEDQKMDGLASTANSITGEMFQSTTHATMEHTKTDNHKMIDTPGTTMTGKLVSFEIQKLWDLLSHEHGQFQGVQDQVTELKRDLRLLSSFLKNANVIKHTSEVVRKYVNVIEEIIFDAEDIIETFILKYEDGKIGGINKLIRRLAFITLERRKVALEIGSLSKRISDVIGGRESIGVQLAIVDVRESRFLEERLEFAREYESGVVGMERNVTKLVGYLVEKDDVQVVSITGMGGIGKTTLARQAFNHEMVKKKFDRLAWVCVSHVFNRKNVWQTILHNFRPKEEENEILQMTEATLEGELFRLLETSNSLIVFDDIWNEEDWNLIKLIFPNQKGWKVLLTSRNDNVAGCGGMHINFKLECLSAQDSWTLFQRIVMPSKDPSELKNIDKEMEKMGKQMVEHCGGLPLAVKVLGGLLAAKYTLLDWKRVHVMIGHLNDSSVYHVLSLSFEELPSILMHCFLYLAHFPKDYEINVEDLVYFLAAEGMIRQNDGETIRDVGDMVIEELVRRNMVISERDNTSSRFETCHLHDVMRDLCLLKAEEKNFLQFIGISSPTAHSQSISTSRRYVSQHPTTLDVEREINNSKVRSLMVVKRRYWKLTSISFTRLKLLRVLHFPGAGFKGGKLPSDIGELIHLRYLNLEHARVSHLPSSLQNLKLLIYLNLNLDMVSIFVPNVLMEMKELRYLTLPKYMDKKTKLDLSHLVNLETLKNFSSENCSLEDLQYMARLSTLGVILTGEIYLETLMPILEKLGQLKEVFMHGNSFCGRRMVCSGGGFPQLQKLELCGLEELEEWIVEEGSMPLLHILSIDNCKKLKELPDGLRFIPSFKNLRVYNMGEEWKKRLSKGGEDYYKVQQIPSVQFHGE